MCGIAGLWQLSSSQEDSLEKARRLQGLLKKRGPDGQGLFVESDGSLSLVHTLLAITDQSAAARQPMFSADKQFVMVFNGEIYNTAELKKNFLPGLLLQTTTDTEIIVELFAKLGEKTFALLEGIFALAIWDQATKTLWLARDYLGIKPLYFYYDDQAPLFAFASLAKILATTQGLWDPDYESVKSFLKYGCTLAPRTIFKKIQALPCGRYLKFSLMSRSFKLFAYQKLENLLGPSSSKGSLTTDLKTTLKNVIASQIPSKVRYGVFLSAGVDSNLLAALLQELGQKFATFTIGFSSQNKHLTSEAALAKKLAAHWGAEHHEWILQDTEVPKLYDEYLQALDQPSSDGFNSFLAAKLAAPFCKVVFSGIGADELFLGYWHFAHLHNWYKMSQNNLRPAWYAIASWLRNFPYFKSFLFRQKHYFLQDPALQNDILAAYLFYRQEEKMPFAISQSVGQKLKEIFTNSAFSFWQKMVLAELFFYDQNKLLKDIDSLSMYHGVEVRVPFLDRRIVSYALASLADLTDQTFAASFGKQNLRKLLASYHPPALLATKQGFELPLEQWLTKGVSRKAAFLLWLQKQQE